MLKEKLKNIKDAAGKKIRIMIMGLGSVGNYLLDQIISTGDESVEIIVVGRDAQKLTSDVNIARIAGTIRRQNRCNIVIEPNCDFNSIDDLCNVLKKHNPHFVINSSRVYAGLKYGSISWNNFRAYGIWTPLSVKLAKNISAAVAQVCPLAIFINTSYSDAVIPWLKSAGLPHPVFGSGNLNHLVPRIKYAAAEILGVSDFWNIDVTIATGHFHDVVISKEGHDENTPQLLCVCYKGEIVKIDNARIFERCKIAMPSDQRRNMMNASSNFDIIFSIIKAVRSGTKEKIHSPGAMGEMGGYPFIIDGSALDGYIDQNVFSLDQMRAANQKSMYLDGIRDIESGNLHYTPELVASVKKSFDIVLPDRVNIKDVEKTVDFLIENIISKA